MKKSIQSIPQFKSETEERIFWETHDSTAYFDWSTSRPTVFPNLKPSSKMISLRLPNSLLNSIKVLANQRDVPYQSLIKTWLVEKVSKN